EYPPDKQGEDAHHPAAVALVESLDLGLLDRAFVLAEKAAAEPEVFLLHRARHVAAWLHRQTGVLGNLLGNLRIREARVAVGFADVAELHRAVVLENKAGALQEHRPHRAAVNLAPRLHRLDLIVG